MKKWLASLPLWAALLWVNPVLSNEAAPLAEDPVDETATDRDCRRIALPCLPNESLAGSRADLAMDLRREVRTLIKSGKSDAEIKKLLVDRYGDFILYNPPVKPTTWLLWFGPLALLLLAIGVLLNVVRRNQRQTDTPVLDAQQRAGAQALLQETSSKK